MGTPHLMEDVAEEARVMSVDFKAIRSALTKHGFVVIEPGQEELDLDLIMAAFGEPVEYDFGTKLAIEPKAGSRNRQFSTREMPLHTDAVLNTGSAVRYIGMKCLAAPEVGGETLVASSRAFFRHAPEDLLAILREIEIDYTSRVDGYYNQEDAQAIPREAPVRIDPETDEETLYIALSDPEDPTRSHDAAVVGYDKAQIVDLFHRIDAQLRRPEVLYAHRWKIGQVLILDNLRVVHGRAAFPSGARKIMRLSVA